MKLVSEIKTFDVFEQTVTVELNLAELIAIRLAFGKLSTNDTADNFRKAGLLKESDLIFGSANTKFDIGGNLYQESGKILNMSKVNIFND